ncbi:MAG: formylglycine-generating enzyme family protein [Thermoguttaceae bacterium]|jgi:formylglycine-generating enzyme required for sulfatase activity|nr:formylglycine-generating enzyme family protein [Thermoguttaceae bacterium]
MEDVEEKISVPKEWTNVLGMKFKLVRAGTFDMGSPRNEFRRFADELLHSVTLTENFFLAVFPMTQAEWRAVLGENPSKYPSSKRAPVESVSWYDCMDFIERINEKEYALELRNYLGANWQYSLPTEAQWEYSCRAGSSTPYYFGSSPSGNEGNFGKTTVDSNKLKAESDADQRLETTSDVGLYPPNPWGFYDMCGNVCEWTLDGYADYDPKKKVDPVGVSLTAERVARGGNWRSLPENCRSASRFNFLPTYRGDNCGLRVAIVRKQ